MANKILLFLNELTNPIVKGSTMSFGIAANNIPASDITVSFTNANGYIASISNKTFTTANYNIPQSVTVTANTNGTVEGEKSESLTITASGGGYAFTKTITLRITDSGLDSQFISGYNWKRRVNIITTGDITTKRTYLQNAIFNGAGLPSANTPTENISSYTGTMGQTTVASLVGDLSVNRLKWEMLDPDGATWTHYCYHIQATSNNGKCVMVCGGHSSETQHLNQINDLLASSFDVLYVFLPVTFQNTETSSAVGGIGVSGHNDIVTGGVDRVGFNGLELYFFDKIRSINYAVANFSYSSYYVCGASGGGWYALMIQALDTRVIRSVPIRGVKPEMFRLFTDETGASFDYEQGPTVNQNGDSNVNNCGARVQAMYDACSFWDIIILACSGGRRVHMSNHAADSCCLYKFTYNLWSAWMIDKISSLGGTFNLTLSTNASYTTHGFNTNDRAIVTSEFS